MALPTVACHLYTMLRRDDERQPERSLFTVTADFRRDMAGLSGLPAATRSERAQPGAGGAPARLRLRRASRLESDL